MDERDLDALRDPLRSPADDWARFAAARGRFLDALRADAEVRRLEAAWTVPWMLDAAEDDPAREQH